MPTVPYVPIPCSYWVTPGLFLAGEYPGARLEAAARPKLRAFLDCGIRLFINLTEEGELVPYATLLAEEAAALGVDAEHLRIPIRDLGVPEPPTLRRILQILDAAARAGRPAYVHCWGGIGRTGTIVGCWLREQGYEGEAALHRIAALRRGTPDRWQPSPETDEQRRLVVDWPALPSP